MEIDGQCHCGRGDLSGRHRACEKVSICHCTDCQNLTGSPYRVTVICSEEQVRMTGAPAKIYAKTGDNGRRRFQHFCEGCGSPLFTSGDGGPDDWGIRWGSIRQRDQLKPLRDNLVPLRSALDQRYQGFAWTVGRRTQPDQPEVSNPCIKGGRRAKQAARAASSAG